MLLAVLVMASLAGCTFVGSPPSSSSFLPESSSLPGSSSSAVQTVMPPQDTNINLLTGLARPEGMMDGQRPVAITIANNQRALPQRGVAAADVVYEMVTEGGVTRLMALYSDYNALPQVGPVRSTRDQFVQFALPVNAVPVHIGTSIYARNLLTLLDYKTIDGIYLGTTSFFFDYERAHPKPEGKLNEYCWYTDAGLVMNGMNQVDIYLQGEVPPLFWFATATAAAQATAHNLSVIFSGDTEAAFAYNPETGLYAKNIIFNVPERSEAPHADEDGTQLAFTNVIILECPITLKPDGRCTDFALGGGTGYYFTGGGVQKITWQKGDPTQPLNLFAEDGSMLQVQRGKSYIGVVGTDVENAVTYTAQASGSVPEDTSSASSIPSAASSTPPAA